MSIDLRRWAGVTALALLAACGQPASDADAEPVADVESAAAPVANVELAVATARAIKAQPMAIDSILREHGLTRADFDALLYDIAADPELARSYAMAMK